LNRRAAGGRASARSDVELVIAEPSRAEDFKRVVHRHLDRRTFRRTKRYDCDEVRR
jgi:hypothetical protein